MVGTVTVVIHDSLFTVTTTVVLGTSVDGAAGTDDVISVEKGVTFTARRTGRRFQTRVNSWKLGLCLPKLFLILKKKKNPPAFRAKNKNNGGEYQREQWEPALRCSSIGKADAELSLPAPP